MMVEETTSVNDFDVIFSKAIRIYYQLRIEVKHQHLTLTNNTNPKGIINNSTTLFIALCHERYKIIRTNTKISNFTDLFMYLTASNTA